jgi:hypothetical protein
MARKRNEIILTAYAAAEEAAIRIPIGQLSPQSLRLLKERIAAVFREQLHVVTRKRTIVCRVKSTARTNIETLTESLCATVKNFCREVPRNQAQSRTRARRHNRGRPRPAPALT